MESASIGEGSQGSEEEMDANAVGPASSMAETPVEAAADDEEDTSACEESASSVDETGTVLAGVSVPAFSGMM